MTNEQDDLSIMTPIRILRQKVSVLTVSKRHSFRGVVVCVVAWAFVWGGSWGFGAEPDVPKIQASLGKILSEDRVADSAFVVCEQVALLPDQAKYEKLASYVLPFADHATLRLDYDMTPLCPSPLVGPIVSEHSQAMSPLLGRFSGSEFVSPALELIRVATRLGKLPVIRTQVIEWNAASIQDRKSVMACLAAVAVAERNHPEAESQLQSLVDMARTPGESLVDRTPETFGLWATAPSPELHPLAEELATILFEDARRDQPRRSELWKRLVLAKRQSLLKPPSTESAPQSLSPQWISVSRMHSETRGAGYPAPVWQVWPGKAFHQGGHDHDYLYYQSPLTGKFTLELDATTFSFLDIHTGYASYWAGPAWDLKSVVKGDYRGNQYSIPLPIPLTRMYESMRVRLDVHDDLVQRSINGRLVDTQPLPRGGDPWLSIHSWWNTFGTVSNLRITGDPVIPEVVSPLTPGLDGWMAYYDESVGWQNADWFVQSEHSAAPLSGLFGLLKNAQTDSPELLARRREDHAGTFSESLLRYHRPMIEDGTMEYEFYYEPGQSHVHPVLDRMCLILNPDGVDIHWATDGRHDPTGIDPGNLVIEPQHRRSKGPLPLKPSQWNQLQLTTRGDTVEIALNGQIIFSRPLESTNLRTFGLFHWAEQSEVRVRNMQWKGSWPRQLPSPSDQLLADFTLEELLGDRNALPSVLEHQFRNGLPSQLFSVIGDDWQSHVKQREDGLQVSRPGSTDYLTYTVLSPLTLQGDFDIIVEFDEFQSQVEAGGEGNIELTVSLDDEHASSFHLFRKHYVFPENRMEQIAQAAISRKRGAETQYSFFAAPAEETVTGRLRIVRRGTTLFGLIAERDSKQFRLIHRETMAPDDARFRFIVGHNKPGITSVLWKSLDIRAEGNSGAITGPLKSVAELDSERAKLPAHRQWDFHASTPQAGKATLGEFSIFGEAAGRFTPEREGLRIDVPGADNWSASGLGSRQQIEGDFDIAIQLDVLHLEPCMKYNESCVFLQTEFRDKHKSTIETKFAIHHAGDRKAETSQRRLRSDGELEYQELVSQPSEDATLLRLSRRGDVVYQVFQNPTQKSPVILGAVWLGREPVAPGDLRALIHTGGENRTTSIRFITLDVWAEKLTDPK